MPDSETRAAALICYDGSDPARHAIATAGELLAPAPALVATAWQPVSIALASYTWGAPALIDDDEQIDRTVADRALQTAREGSELAREAGFDAEPVALEADGPLWQAIIDAAAERRAAVIVAGSRGLRGIKSVMLGSVSSGIVHHGGRPVLVIPAADGSQ